jgi:hypothetical protein
MFLAGTRVVIPQSFSATAGTGGDDRAAIQAAIDEVAGSGGGIVFLPATPSGYHVCGSLVLWGKDRSLTLLGSGPGAGGIKMLPATVCPTGAEAVLVVNVWGPVSRSRARVTIEGLRIDGAARTRYGIDIRYAVGLVIRNTVVRNSVSGSGTANIRIAAGYEYDIDHSVHLENVNDTPGAPYANNSDMPDYNFTTSGTDGRIAAVAVNARIANFHQSSGGNNDFSNAHGWGYAIPNDDHQIDGRPNYTYLVKGSATLIGSVADHFKIAGVHVSAMRDNGVDPTGGQIIGIRCMAGSGSCISLDGESAPLVGWVVVANNTERTPSPISSSGPLPPGTIVGWNVGDGLSAPTEKLSTTPSIPASSRAPCTPGMIAVETNHIYACTATNTWKRATLSPF